MVYDEEGRMVFCIKGISCIFGASTDTTRLSDLIWQPRAATTYVFVSPHACPRGLGTNH